MAKIPENREDKQEQCNRGGTLLLVSGPTVGEKGAGILRPDVTKFVRQELKAVQRQRPLDPPKIKVVGAKNL